MILSKLTNEQLRIEIVDLVHLIERQRRDSRLEPFSWLAELEDARTELRRREQAKGE